MSANETSNYNPSDLERGQFYEEPGGFVHEGTPIASWRGNVLPRPQALTLATLQALFMKSGGMWSGVFDGEGAIEVGQGFNCVRVLPDGTVTPSRIDDHDDPADV